MRAKEIISEETTEWPNDSQAALPNAQKWPELDNSNPYRAYRFGVALAGAPDKNTPQSGPVGQNIMTIGYTEAEREILKAAGEIMGVSGVDVTTDGSKESDGTNNVSPVPHNSGKARKKRS